MSRVYTLKRARPAGGPQIDYAAELNPQQFEAVTAPPGPALVIAGAGSGKTRTLTYRVAYLLEHGASPSSILLLTFTNKAAREMLDRVSALIPHDLAGLWGGTFHSVGNRILRRHTVDAGLRPGFSIMDREDQKELLDAVVADAGISTKDKRFPKGDVLAEMFSLAANTGEDPGEVLDRRYPYFAHLEAQIRQVHEQYGARKRAANSADFDDLLVKVVALFRASPEIAARYQEQFRHILVDEYQDTNRLQSQLIDALAAKHGNVMVVGDDAQSIYSWRGADFRNILQFPNRYPGAKVFKIEINYRSVPEVLQVANAAILGNPGQFEKALSSDRAGGAAKPALVALPDSAQQAQFVAQRILELRDEGVDLREIAVLYRAHYHSMELQMELTRRGVPFQITSGLRFFEQAHIKDVASFLKFAANPADELAFKRMARLLPGIGGGTADKLWRQIGPALVGNFPSFGHALMQGKVGTKSRVPWQQLIHTMDEIAPGGKPGLPAAMIEAVIEAIYDEYLKAKFTNWESRREDLHTLAGYARQFEGTDEFLAQLALLTSLETEQVRERQTDDEEAVTLSSIHQAKGLEWQAVFVIWLADGMFPSVRSLDDEETLAEERRLFYVAVTRAKDDLFLSYPLVSFSVRSGEMFQRPSRFLGEIPPDLLETWEIAPEY